MMYLPRRVYLSRLMKKAQEIETRNRKVFILLSCDTEFDPPSRGETYKTRSVASLLDGLPRFLELCEQYDAPATFFSEGKLVEERPDTFRGIAVHHEIGCHSYAHEWLGSSPPPRWIIGREELPILSSDVKASIIGRAVKSIEAAVGKKPKSFRAPWGSVDDASTLMILEQNGFDSDSSLPWYNDQSYAAPFPLSPTRHVSSRDLWSEGESHLIEVPFMIRPEPLLFQPYRQEVIDSFHAGVEFALEGVDIECKLDALAGRDFTLVQVTSHPWEFSDVGPWGRGSSNAKTLQDYIGQLCAVYDVEFMTVAEFTARWEKEYCPKHGSRTKRSTLH